MKNLMCCLFMCLFAKSCIGQYNCDLETFDSCYRATKQDFYLSVDDPFDFLEDVSRLSEAKFRSLCDRAIADVRNCLDGIDRNCSQLTTTSPELTRRVKGSISLLNVCETSKNISLLYQNVQTLTTCTKILSTNANFKICGNAAYEARKGSFLLVDICRSAKMLQDCILNATQVFPEQCTEDAVQLETQVYNGIDLAYCNGGNAVFTHSSIVIAGVVMMVLALRHKIGL